MRRIVQYSFITVFILFIIGSCGIPEIRSLPKPIKVDTESLGLNNSVLAFKTPADITNIQGYALFYKVYYSQTDFTLEEDERKWFDENHYINDNDEMQPGSVIGDQRGFIRVGALGADTDSYPSYLILNPALPSTTIFLDFDSDQHRAVMSDDSPEPIVGNQYPITAITNTLSRGVIDPTAGSDDSFRSFIADWDFDDGSSGDNFHDADLRRRHNKPSSVTTPAGTTDFFMAGDSFFEISPQTPTQWIIGFVVYSYGIDPTKFQILYSKPVFIGAVGYSPINDTKRPNVIRP